MSRKKIIARLSGTALLIFLALSGQTAWADQGAIEAGETTLQTVERGSDLAQVVREMQIQMQKMQETINSQNTEIQMLKQTQASRGEGVPTPPPSAPAFDLNTFQDMLGSNTSWIKGLKQGGDMRLRMENFRFYHTDADHGATDRGRNRFRIRLRYGFEKGLGDDFNAGFRLVTGSATDPNSSNVTLGNPGYFNYKPVFLDQAYATYKPHQLKDLWIFKDLTLGGGKFANPFLKYATTMMWDADVTPEGLYESINLNLFDTPENKLKSTINLGQMLLNENSGPAADAELYAYQVALNYSTEALNEMLNLEKSITFTTALSYYQFVNYWTTVIAPAGGSSLLRTNIRPEEVRSEDSPQVLDFYPQISLDLFERNLKIFGNYIKNVRNHAVGGGSGVGREGPGFNDSGYGIGFRYGRNNKPGDWEVNYAYYYLGANATAAAFNDSDFGGPGYNGFTNRKGSKFGLTYRLTPGLELNWTGYLVTPVNDFNAASFSTSEKVFRNQADLVWKF